MRSSELPSLDELSRMREKLNRIEEQIRKSQQEFSNNIIIGNPVKSRFILTINIEDSPGKEPTSLLSKVHPDTTALSPRASPTKEPSQNQENFHEEEKRRGYRDQAKVVAQRVLEGSRFRSQRRFFSANNNPICFEYEHGQSLGPGVGEKEEKQKREEHIFINDDESEIQLEALSIPPIHQNDVAIKDVTETYQKQSKSLQDTPQIIEDSVRKNGSPMVFSYIHQQIRKQHPEVNTSYKGSSLQIGELTIEPSTNRLKPKNVSQTRKLRVEQIEESIKSSSTFNPLTHITAEERVNKINHFTNAITTPPSKNSVEKSVKSKNLIQSQQKTFKKGKSTQRSVAIYQQLQTSSPQGRGKKAVQKKHSNAAEKLVRERKQLIPVLNERQKLKEERDRHNRFLGRTKERANSKSSQKYTLSPKLLEITDRLHRSKQRQSPCSYYAKHNESSDRQQFNLMVEQNPFVARYVCLNEREELFQKLRSSSDSVSLWPMKIVSYTYNKLQRSLSAVQSLLQ